MSTLAASITSYFVQQSENTDLGDLAIRLDRIERLLAHLADKDEPILDALSDAVNKKR